MKIQLIPLGMIQPSPFNRKVVSDSELRELADNIKHNGVLEPIAVRNVAESGKELLEIIYGERRWRAAKIAGLKEIPGVVHAGTTDVEVIEMQYGENVARKNINPVEEGEALYQLTKLGETPEDLARKLKKSKAYIYGRISLASNNTSEVVRNAVRKGDLSGSHAELIATVEDIEKQQNLTDRVIDQRLSVRELEVILKQQKKKTSVQRKGKEPKRTPVQKVNAKLEAEKKWRIHVAREILKRVSWGILKAQDRDLRAFVQLYGPRSVQGIKPPRGRISGQIIFGLIAGEISGENKPRTLMAFAKRARVNVTKFRKSTRGEKATRGKKEKATRGKKGKQ